MGAGMLQTVLVGYLKVNESILLHKMNLYSLIWTTL